MNVFKIVLTILSSLNLYSQTNISFSTFKIENKQEVKKQDTKKEEVKKEEKKEKTEENKKEEVRRNQIEMDGKYFNISPNVLVENLYDYDAVNNKIQTYIDKGGISLAGYSLDTDGKGSLISGHNPGIMGYFAQNIKKGKIITTYDKNGKARKYKVVEYETTPINNEGANYVNDKMDELLESLYSKEVFLLQYCIEPLMYVWKAVPVEE